MAMQFAQARRAATPQTTQALAQQAQIANQLRGQEMQREAQNKASMMQGGLGLLEASKLGTAATGAGAAGAGAAGAGAAGAGAAGTAAGTAAGGAGLSGMLGAMGPVGWAGLAALALGALS